MWMNVVKVSARKENVQNGGCDNKKVNNLDRMGTRKGKERGSCAKEAGEIRTLTEHNLVKMSKY